MPRFTLRTLFVVVTLIAVALGWVAWQRSIVHRRQAVLAQIVRDGGGYLGLGVEDTVHHGQFWCDPVGPSFDNDMVNGIESRGPWIVRQWMGDEVVMSIALPAGSDSTTASIMKSLFPEVAIICQAKESRAP